MGTINQMKRVWRWLGCYGRDRRGNISTMVALLIIPLAGVLGVATETGSWYVVQRAEQNAADAAVLAAAQNGIFGGTTYATEGRQVASNLGFVDGANFTTVTPVNAQTCPAPLSGSNCYKVTITRTVPVNLTRIVGYRGTGGTGRQTVIASAMAGPVSVAVSNCISSLGTGSDSYRVNGGPSVNLNGCTIEANGDIQCSGNNADGNVSYFFLHGSNNGCNPTVSGMPTLTDPYTTTYPRTNIPANNCNAATNNCLDPTLATSYWQQSGNYSGNGNGNGNNNNGPAQPTFNNWSGGTKSPGVYRGDITVHANTTMSAGTYVIENGSLIIDSGVTLSGTGVTIIFSGPTISGFNPSHLPPTSGTLDISAPDSTSTSVWKGVALYQDPNLTSGVDWTSNGSSLTWNVTGLIYMPNSNLLFSGTINKATGGNDCFTLIDTTFRVNGNVTLTERQTQCVAAGLSPPTSNLPRATLVQ